MRGELLWFNEAKGQGLIRTDEGERIAVDRSGFVPGHVPEGRCAGTTVTFEREAPGPDGVARALGVAVLDEQPGRRARMRHHRGGN
jgi:cold shock CspA family protein